MIKSVKIDKICITCLLYRTKKKKLSHLFIFSLLVSNFRPVVRGVYLKWIFLQKLIFDVNYFCFVVKCLFLLQFMKFDQQNMVLTLIVIKFHVKILSVSKVIKKTLNAPRVNIIIMTFLNFSTLMLLCYDDFTKDVYVFWFYRIANVYLQFSCFTKCLRLHKIIFKI